MNLSRENKIMKKIILTITSIIACYGLYSFYTQTPSTVTSCPIEETLVVGISPDYPPYALIDFETGNIVGLEVDVITEIAHRLNKKLEIKDMPFNSLVVELLSGHIDIIAAGMCPSEERKKTILFSNPYVDNDNNVIVTKKTNTDITELKNLFGRSVAVNIGYSADTFLSKYPEIQLVRLKLPTDGFMSLQSDSVQAFAIAQSTYGKFLESYNTPDDYKSFILPASADACALAFAKNNTKLQQEINPILDAMIEDGTMQIIKNKWGF